MLASVISRDKWGKFLFVTCIWATLVLLLGSCSLIKSKAKITLIDKEISFPKENSDRFPQWIPDLEKVKDYYNQGKYEAAAFEMQRLTTLGMDWENWELISWMAKVMHKLDIIDAFYVSGWLYFANDVANNDIWDAKGYIFSKEPVYISLFILTLLPDEKAQIPKNILNGATATAVFVQTQLRLQTVKKRGLTNQDIKFFEDLEMRLDGITKEIDPYLDRLDLVFLLADSRFSDLRVNVDLLKNQQSKKELNEATKELFKRRYNQIWVGLKPIVEKFQNSPDLLLLAGKALLEVGTYDTNKHNIKKALEILKKSRKIKPSKTTEELIARALKQL